MANKILKLQSRQPNKPLIELLEKLLDDARDGSLVTMIAVTEYPEAFNIYTTSGIELIKLIGMLEYAKLHVMAENQNNG